MTIRCCVCHLEKVEGEWKRPEDFAAKNVSHTYCPDCLTTSLAAIKEEFAQAKRHAANA